MDELKNNLNIDKKNNHFFKFNKSDIIKDSIIIEAELSFKLVDPFEIFLLLKSYVNNQYVVVKNIFIFLKNEKDFKENKFIRQILLRDINNLDEYNKFYDWWEKIGVTVWHYETDESKLTFLIFLIPENIINAFKISKEEVFYIKPIFPWKKNIVSFFLKEENTIKKLNNLLIELSNKKK